MIDIQINFFHNTLPQEVTLVAVSKFKPSSDILEAYEAGQRIFAESRADELAMKACSLPSDIQWHFIGHLQTNKLTKVLPYVSLIQSVDSERLLGEICSKTRLMRSRAVMSSDAPVRVLLECHIAHEDSKQGFMLTELPDVLSRYMAGEWPEVQICGLMGMASFSSDELLVRSEFATLRSAFESCRSQLPACDDAFSILSMGMTSDWRLAVEEGATMVRIGSAIFGAR